MADILTSVNRILTNAIVFPARGILLTGVWSMKIFILGRICMFGEHSDWAGGFRRVNADIEMGYTLIYGLCIKQVAMRKDDNCYLPSGTILIMILRRPPE
jgi:hypothetical protein